ncbi:hypothetical protein BGZ92_007223 [Podila epicladia]|nr:hypothetical protein BGZ92_007223 [Podila epicladia]
MLANNSNSGNIGTHYSLQEHDHQSSHHSPHDKFTKDAPQFIFNGNMAMTSPERSASSPSSYYLPAVQSRTTSYPPSSHRHKRNSTSSSTIHPTIANLVTPTRASTSPINKASSSPASFYKTYSPIVASFMSTTPERQFPKHETPQRHYQYLNYRYDDTIEEISDESESMMDNCEPQRGWSTSSSRQTNSPSPVMAPADLHKLSLHDQPYGAQDSSHRHHSQYQPPHAQPPLSRHHYKEHPKEHGHSILLPPTNIPEQDCNMDVEFHEPQFEADSQQIPSKMTIATATNTSSSTTTTFISKPNPKRPPKEKRKRSKPIRAVTMPMRPSYYEQMSDAQKRLYDHHPRSPEYEDDSEEDEDDEDSSEPTSPRSFSSMSRSPSPSRRTVARSNERPSKDELGPGQARTSDVSLSYHSNYQPQYQSYGSRHQTMSYISQSHYQQQHPYHHPDPFHSKRSSYGSPQFPHQEKSFMDSQPRLYSRPPPQQQQQQHQQLPMRRYRRQHRPHQLLQQSLHAAGSLDGYSYASAPLTASSISSTDSSSCSSMPALSPTGSFFLPSTMSLASSGHGSHNNNIPNLPGTEGMTVVRNEDGSIMVYNPATDAMTFRCELCPLESFGRIHDLKMHQTSKHQEMTWPCDFCHRPFVRRDALLRHYTVKAARDDGIHPASHEVEKLLEARARAKMLY